MTEPTRELLFCAVALLEQGRRVDRLSRPLTAAALIVFLVYPALMGPPPWTPVAFAVVVAIAGLAEAYFAMRVDFDATLFRQLANAPQPLDFAGTDAALTRLGLPPADKLGRPAEARIAGARRLFGFQALALVAQVLSVMVGTCIALMWQ
jgi:hypothetical protein